MLVPELDVTDLAASLRFYVGVLEFRILFERPAERFAYLERNGVELMIQEAGGPGRRFPAGGYTDRVEAEVFEHRQVMPGAAAHVKHRRGRLSEGTVPTVSASVLVGHGHVLLHGRQTKRRLVKVGNEVMRLIGLVDSRKRGHGAPPVSGPRRPIPDQKLPRGSPRWAASRSRSSLTRRRSPNAGVF